MGRRPKTYLDKKALEELSSLLGLYSKDVKGIVKRINAEKFKEEIGVDGYHFVDNGLHQIRKIVKQIHHHLDMYVLDQEHEEKMVYKESTGNG